MENFSDDPGIDEGDMFLASDPWIGASHQMDVLHRQPGVRRRASCSPGSPTPGHQYDLGGVVPGGWPQNAVDIYSDPVVFSPFKIVERGVLRTDLERMYAGSRACPTSWRSTCAPR